MLWQIAIRTTSSPLQLTVVVGAVLVDRSVLKPTIVGENADDQSWVTDYDNKKETASTVRAAGSELLMAPHEFRPLHLISIRKGIETWEDCCTVAILQLGGVHERSRNIRVGKERSSSLKLSATWPDAAMLIRFLLPNLLEGKTVPLIDKFHPAIGGFCEAC